MPAAANRFSVAILFTFRAAIHWAEPEHDTAAGGECVGGVSDALGYHVLVHPNEVHLFVWADDDAHV
jgi:hypothetical protein